PSGGGLTSRSTSLSLAMMTLSPSTGTLRFGQVAGSDHLIGPVAGAWATASALPKRNAGTSDPRRTERFFLLMEIHPLLEGDPFVPSRERTRGQHDATPP